MVPQFQLALELSHVFSLGTLVQSTGTALLDFARDLRKTGSDIVVEEDLANIFGRCRVEKNLNDEFRKKVVKDAKIVPLYAGSQIDLASGPGPTVSRALREKDRKYLSTVIQFSLLGWTHDRTDLAASIVECISKRSMEIQTTSINPTFEDVLGTLDACSSQTSLFSWDKYIRYVETTIREKVSPDQLYVSGGFITGISPTVLLAFMDYLFIVQQLREDRVVMVRNQQGIIPIIVWAHCVLDLTVSVHIGENDRINFGNDSSPQVIIMLSEKTDAELGLVRDEVLLLDREMDVILRCCPEDGETHISPQERHCLTNYGSDYLRRQFNCRITTLDDDAVYHEAIKLILARAINLSSYIYGHEHEDNEEHFSNFRRSRLERWRIFDAAHIIFQDFIQTHKFDKKAIDQYCALIVTQISSDEPRQHACQNYLTRVKKSYKNAETSEKRLDSDFEIILSDLTQLVLVFASAIGVTECGTLPLDFNLRLVANHQLGEHLSQTEQDQSIRECLFLDQAIAMLIGWTSNDDVQKDSFVISDFGWSIILNCVGDNDPADIDPSLFYIKQGVPTSSKTGERKKFVADFRMSIRVQSLAIVDRGNHYVPRCLMPVVERTLYYASRRNTFLLTIRYTVGTPESQKTFDQSTSYKRLHQALWKIMVTKSCKHSKIKNNRQAATLGLDVASTTGLSWNFENRRETEKDNNVIPERICISLVKGDRRARWLAVEAAARSTERGAILRSEDCCEDCALRYTTELSDKWILII